jgi:hypothetical protein
MIMALLAFILIFKRSSPQRFNTTRLVDSFLSQNFDDISRLGKHLLLKFVWFYLTFFVIHCITANFKTDLIQSYPAKKIESVKDLAESPMIPLFPQFMPIYDIFKSGIKPEYKRVWEKCEGREKLCIMENNAKGFERAFKMVEQQKACMVYLGALRRAFNSYGCKYKNDWKKYLHLAKRIHDSKPFMKEVKAFVMNKNVKKEVKDRLDLL